MIDYFNHIFNREPEAWRLTQALTTFTMGLNYDESSGFLFTTVLIANTIILTLNVTAAWVRGAKK